MSPVRAGCAAAVALAAVLSAGCARGGDVPAGTPALAGVHRISPDLQVAEIAPGVWLHTSWGLAGGTRYPSNGLLVRDGAGLLLVDPAWGEAPTAALLDWIAEEIRLPVRRAVSTHWHDDRLGGGPVLRARGVPLVAHPLTRRIAVERGLTVPDPLEALARPGAVTRVGPAEVFYPGPGHAVDNVMVWLPRQGILYGGCAVRELGASTLGNTADADLEAWPESIRRAIARYGDARVVVPGHGAPGGPELLRHTLELFDG